VINNNFGLEMVLCVKIAQLGLFSHSRRQYESAFQFGEKHGNPVETRTGTER